MLRNLFSQDQTVDFTEVTDVILLGREEKPSASYPPTSIYLQVNESGECNYTIYLHQSNDQTGEVSKFSVNVPDAVIPETLRHKFGDHSVTLKKETIEIATAELKKNLSEHLAKNHMQTTHVRLGEQDEHKSSCKEKAATYAVVGLIGAVVGGGVGELIEPFVNYLMGEEFDEKSDVPFYVMTGAAGLGLALLIKYCGCFANCCQNLSFSCPNSLPSLGGMWQRARGNQREAKELERLVTHDPSHAASSAPRPGRGSNCVVS